MQRTKRSDLFNYLLLLFERLLRDQLHLPDPGDASFGLEEFGESTAGIIHGRAIVVVQQHDT